MSENSPKNLEEALKLIAQLQAEITQLHEENKKLEVVANNLSEMLAKSRKMMFGRSSEKIKNMYGHEQLTFFNEAEQEYNSGAPEPKEDTIVQSYKRKSKRTKAEITENLEHKEEIIDLPEDEKKCSICGAELVCIGKEKLRSELNIVPAQVFVIDYYRYVYKCPESAVVRDVIGDYSGYLQTDGYSAYNAAEKATHIGCWAHARRKFVDCLPKGIDDKNSKAAKALDIIERLFSIEQGLKGMPEGEIRAARTEKSVPLLNKYWELLQTVSAPGGSKLYQAVNYSLNHKTELEGYLADGRIEMTNNRAERAVKPFVIARKNFLFSDTSRGAESSALCFSMIESAKLNNLNVYGYLIYLFSELPKLGQNPPKEKLTRFLPWSRELPSYCKKV